METNWYVMKSPEDKISQGDILLNCPIYLPDPPQVNYSSPTWFEEEIEIEYGTYIGNVVVLTQACDLERNPVGQVLVARIEDVNKIDFPAPTNPGKPSTRKNYIESIYEGAKPNLHLIGKNEVGIEINYQIVDFAALLTIPYVILKDFAEQCGPRLRLNTPHREYLSQRFGSFISRIGLPNEDHITKKELRASVNSEQKHYQITEVLEPQETSE